MRAPAELAAGGAPAEADRSLPELRGDAVHTAHPAGCSRVPRPRPALSLWAGGGAGCRTPAKAPAPRAET